MDSETQDPVVEPHDMSCFFDNGDKVLKMFEHGTKAKGSSILQRRLPMDKTNCFYIGEVVKLPNDDKHLEVHWQCTVDAKRNVVPNYRKRKVKIETLVHLLQPGVPDKSGCTCRAKLIYHFGLAKSKRLYENWFVPPLTVDPISTISTIDTAQAEVVGAEEIDAKHLRAPETRKRQRAEDYILLERTTMLSWRPDVIDDALKYVGLDRSTKNYTFSWPAADPLMPFQDPSEYADDFIDSDSDFVENEASTFTVMQPFVTNTTMPAMIDGGTNGEMKRLEKEISIMACNMYDALDERAKSRIPDCQSFISDLSGRVAEAVTAVGLKAVELAAKKYCVSRTSKGERVAKRCRYADTTRDWRMILAAADALQFPKQLIAASEIKLNGFYSWSDDNNSEQQQLPDNTNSSNTIASIEGNDI